MIFLQILADNLLQIMAEFARRFLIKILNSLDIYKQKKLKVLEQNAMLEFKKIVLL